MHRVAYLTYIPSSLLKESHFDSKDDVPDPRQGIMIVETNPRAAVLTLSQTSCSHIQPVIQRESAVGNPGKVCAFP